MKNISQMFKELRNDFHYCQKEFGNDFKKWIPNIFTMTRIAIIPTIAISGIMGNTLLAGIIAAFGAATDGIDGFLSRKWNCQSEFGRKLDTIADKLLGISLIIGLLPMNLSFLIPLVLETTILYVNVHAERKNLKPKTQQIGRVKTVLLDTTLVAAILSPHFRFLKSFIPFMFGSTVTLQALSLAKYYASSKNSSNNVKKEPKENNNIIEQKEKPIVHTISNKEYLQNYSNSLEHELEKPKTKEINL